jgi:hypothetical protein
MKHIQERKLYELVRDEEVFPCPGKTEYYGTWYEFLVPIGKDHIAQIRMSKEDYDMLLERNKEVEI